MEITAKRNAEVEKTISTIRDILRNGIDVSSLEAAKTELMRLCSKTELFPRIHFPIPNVGQAERTFLIQEDQQGEFALYVNSGGPEQNTEPHNHGGSWAIIAAIEGEELHRLYVETSIDTSEGVAELQQVAEIMVKPGTAVSMLEEGIHSIHGGDKPLLHLHLYAKNFGSQMKRKAYNLKSGSVHQFTLDDVGFIEDAR